MYLRIHQTMLLKDWRQCGKAVATQKKSIHIGTKKYGKRRHSSETGVARDNNNSMD